MSGLFDYSVYSWSRFNQEPSRFDQEGTMTTSPTGQDKDQDQELANLFDEITLIHSSTFYHIGLFQPKRMYT